MLLFQLEKMYNACIDKRKAPPIVEATDEAIDHTAKAA